MTMSLEAATRTTPAAEPLAIPPIGDFLLVFSPRGEARRYGQAAAGLAWPATGGGRTPGRVVVDEPGVHGAVSGAARHVEHGHWRGMVLHHPVPAPAAGAAVGAPLGSALRETAQATGCHGLEALHGKYAAVFWEPRQGRLLAVTDGFRFYPLYYAGLRAGLAVATDLRLLRAVLAVDGGAEIDLHALYHHLNFSYIPTPHTIYRQVRKLPPGTRLEYGGGEVHLHRYWRPAYPEDLDGTEDALAARLRDAVVETVQRHRPGETAWGTFLSGGTDSSSVTGILARQEPDERVASFSIGFEEAEFDEMEYARIAARAFGTDAHFGRVGADDALSALDVLVEAYDEPFGNSSAVPTFYCSRMAREAGVTTLVAGDGGDEIFGGNERYAKDKVFQWFHGLPGVVRGPARLVGEGLAVLDWRPTNKVANFVRRGSLPNPDRFYTDDSFASDYFEQLLSADLRAEVAPQESLEVVRRVYAEAGARSELHRLMYIDLQMAIADNDLTKVNRAARAAGVAVVYPFLDAGLVDFTGRIPAAWKVRGLRKRYLFKRAMADVLPLEIRKKKKQGFGLPVGMWFRRHGGFRELVGDLLFSERARQRGYFNQGFIRHLVERHERGAWDHTQEIWLLLMLELWHRRFVDGHA